MTPHKFSKPEKGDFIIIAALLCVCLLLFALRQNEGGSIAVVTVGGETVFEADLSAISGQKTVELQNGVIITAEPGAIYFSFSPCAGQDCVRTGRLTKAGQTAVCLSEKTVIKIIGKQNKNAPDAIT